MQDLMQEENLDTEVDEILSQIPLRKFVQTKLADYFEHLDGQQPEYVYDLVIKEVEIGLLEFIMKKTKGNQSLAAKWLNLARGTLRKKLQEYHLE